MRIMTWNVRYFGHGSRGLRAFNAWIRRVAGAFGSLEVAPDVICLQEVETRSLRAGLLGASQLDRFVAALSDAVPNRTYRPLYFPAHRYAIGNGPALYTTGLAVLVCDSVRVLEHNADAPHPVTHVSNGQLARFKQARIVAHVRVERDGEPIDLYNTHLSLPAFLEVGPHRIHSQMGHGSNQLNEVAALQAYIEQTRGGAHAVLVGDLNTAPASPVYDSLIGHGWIDALAQVTGMVPEEIGQTHTARFMHLRMHLDHVFSTPSVRWTDLTAYRVGGRGPFVGLSDHSPKIGHFELTG